jgi:hypothetical protein
MARGLAQRGEMTAGACTGEGGDELLGSHSRQGRPEARLWLVVPGNSREMAMSDGHGMGSAATAIWALSKVREPIGQNIEWARCEASKWSCSARKEQATVARWKGAAGAAAEGEASMVGLALTLQQGRALRDALVKGRARGARCVARGCS